MAQIDALAKQSFVIVVLSTTGQGDPPDNARKFVRLLRQRTDKQWLLNVQYAILGRGDTNYDNFCAPAKRVEKSFEQLGKREWPKLPDSPSRALCVLLSFAPTGAKRFHPTALADDATGLEAVVEPFSKNVLVSLQKVLPKAETPAAAAPGAASALPPATVAPPVESKREHLPDSTASDKADGKAPIASTAVRVAVS